MWLLLLYIVGAVELKGQDISYRECLIEYNETLQVHSEKKGKRVWMHYDQSKNKCFIIDQ